MESDSISKLIEDIYRARGIDAAAITLSPSQIAKGLSLVNVNFPPAYESEFWPDVMRVEERTVAAGPCILFSTAGENEIGAIDAETGVTLKDPRIYPDAEIVRKVNIYSRTIWFGDEIIGEGAKVWLRFRPPVPEFCTTAWSGATAYTVGSLVWLSTTGQTYRALLDGTNKAPATETTYWAKVAVPKIFWQFLVLRCSASMMSEEDGRGSQFNAAKDELERTQGIQIDAQQRAGRFAIAQF